MLNYTHPDDQAFLKQQLIPNNLEKLFDTNPVDENGEPRPRTEDEEADIDRALKQDRRRFTIRYTTIIVSDFQFNILYSILFIEWLELDHVQNQ